MIENLGCFSCEDLDDANIPVNIFFSELKEGSEEYNDGFRYRLTADSFMPRKGRSEEGAIEVVAETKEELQQLVQQYILPLYQVALAKVKRIAAGELTSLYYWGTDEEKEGN